MPTSRTPGTPSATVLMTHVRDGVLECLVLADSVLVIETTRGMQTISDDREASVGDRYRNQPGGFWVASVEPAAADEALSGPRAS